MATVTDDAPKHLARDGEDHAHDDHPSDKTYWVVGAVLGVITALEVSTYFITDDPYTHDLKPLLIGTLLTMMVVKFFVIASWFMHLRFDNRVFRWMFVAGLILALVVYGIVFTTFRYWGDDYESGLAVLGSLAL